MVDTKAGNMADAATANIAAAAATAAGGTIAAGGASGGPATPEQQVTRMSFRDRIASISKSVPNGTIPIRVDHEDLELPVEEVIKRAQIGSKLGKLEEVRREYEQTRQQDRAAIQAGTAWDTYLKANPDKAERIQAIIEGREAMPRAGNDPLGGEAEGGGLTDPGVQRTISALERKIDQLSGLVNQQGRAFTTRTNEQLIDDAIESHPFTSQYAEVAETVREEAFAAFQRGEYQTPQDAVAAFATRHQRVAETILDSRRKKLDEQRETASLAPNRGQVQLGLSADELKGIPRTANGIRANKDTIKALLLGKLRQAVSGPS